MAGLGIYLDKRDFGATPEPSDDGTPSRLGLRYSMQNHDATRLHWDLRLEWGGVLLSWAVTRGPSLDPADKRLAVRTEDHPLSYLTFEGLIPKGHYGAGTVLLWDLGWWQPLEPAARGLSKGHLKFRLHGQRMTGDWNLIRMKGRKASDAKRENWLLVKIDDEAAHQRDPVARHRTSVASGRTFAAIRADKPAALPVHPGALPRHQPVQLATLTDDLADAGAHWHELKLDGYRAQVALGQGGPRILTRGGHDWTDRFAELLPALRDLPCKAALLDGEIVAGGGLQGFGTLQDAIKAGGPFRYVAFDLLHLDGRDLTALPLTKRRKALEKLLRPLPPMGAVTLSPIIHGQADEAFAMICGMGGEGVIAKRVDAPYRGGRSRDWLKIKCRRRGEFLIVGWQASDRRGRPFASLAVADRQGEALAYLGKVGTGFDAEAMADLARRMAPLVRGTAPLKVPRREAAGVTWIAPELRIEVDYAETTAQGRLRHAVFLGLRADPPSEPCPPVQARKDRPITAGIAISSANRVIFDKPRLTKAGLADYYAAAAPLMLPELADRPLSLLRLPEGMAGERFFQKHPGKGFPDALRIQAIADSAGETSPHAYATDAAGIVGAVQMGTVEFHIWGARRDRLDRPDRLVFDLDPDEGLGFAATRRAALDLRDRLDGLGLASWAMLSGGKGIHIVVPLRRQAGWDTVRLFSRGVALLAAQSEPKRFTAEMSKARRKGRIFIDWLRNERGATAIAPFSVRARPGAPVACPVSWDELARIRKASAFSTEAALERAWADVVPPDPQGLTARVIKALEHALTRGS
ncbi:DNA ligase D [Paracoccus gahaiensis]|uniref:DNA ligase (ATP) n=1 Tax=Paracoccus gahaiensis TaxID=1706839 RepID=A0A4U0R9U8_9RHOB|nr:DNA ligase D [Paracoccus gahaiensis]TJZ91210.1 DNA ligase D [Paracoccus gahaiensis]